MISSTISHYLITEKLGRGKMDETRSCSAGRLTHRRPRSRPHARRWGWFVAEVAVVLIFLTPSPGAAQRGKRSTACDVKVESLPRLNPLTVQSGRLEKGR